MVARGLDRVAPRCRGGAAADGALRVWVSARVTMEQRACGAHKGERQAAAAARRVRSVLQRRAPEEWPSLRGVGCWLRVLQIGDWV